MQTPIKGEVYYVQFQGDGSVFQGARPALIVQSDFLNTTPVQTTIVCPMTSRIRRLSTHPLILPTSENGLHEASEVVCEQIMTVNKVDLERKIGNLTDEDVRRVEAALLLAFDISNS